VPALQKACQRVPAAMQESLLGHLIVKKIAAPLGRSSNLRSKGAGGRGSLRPTRPTTPKYCSLHAPRDFLKFPQVTVSCLPACSVCNFWLLFPFFGLAAQVEFKWSCLGKTNSAGQSQECGILSNDAFAGNVLQRVSNVDLITAGMGSAFLSLMTSSVINSMHTVMQLFAYQYTDAAHRFCHAHTQRTNTVMRIITYQHTDIIYTLCNGNGKYS